MKLFKFISVASFLFSSNLSAVGFYLEEVASFPEGEDVNLLSTKLNLVKEHEADPYLCGGKFSFLTIHNKTDFPIVLSKTALLDGIPLVAAPGRTTVYSRVFDRHERGCQVDVSARQPAADGVSEIWTCSPFVLKLTAISSVYFGSGGVIASFISKKSKVEELFRSAGISRIEEEDAESGVSRIEDEVEEEDAGITRSQMEALVDSWTMKFPKKKSRAKEWINLIMQADPNTIFCERDTDCEMSEWRIDQYTLAEKEQE